MTPQEKRYQQYLVRFLQLWFHLPQPISALTDCRWCQSAHSKGQMEDNSENTLVSYLATQLFHFTIGLRPSKEKKTLKSLMFSLSICEVILKTAMQFHKEKALTIAFYKMKAMPFYPSKSLCTCSQGRYYLPYPWTLNFIIIFMGGGTAFNKTWIKLHFSFAAK